MSPFHGNGAILQRLASSRCLHPNRDALRSKTLQAAGLPILLVFVSRGGLPACDCQTRGNADANDIPEVSRVGVSLSATRLMPVELLAALAAGYVVILNLACFLAFAWDKRCAQRGQQRVRERTLLCLAGFGGSLGALAGQRYLRHKTRKQPFRGRLRMIVGLQAVVLVGACLLFLPG
jgi:uncharacterized membrane protein YsdA (DUF1294 family)